MTLTETIRKMETVAAGTPSVSSIVRNDIFRLNAAPDARYGVFAWLQGEHSQPTGTDPLRTFNFTFFFVDRLTADKGNEIDIQSAGIETLTNIVRHLEERDGIYPLGPLTFQTFNQRFADECAGVWCSVRLEVPVTYTCADDLTPASFNPDFNNDFNKA